MNGTSRTGNVSVELLMEKLIRVSLKKPFLRPSIRTSAIPPVMFGGLI